MTKVYDGNAYAAGTARATDRNGNNLKIEYSVNGNRLTEDPSEITATEVKRQCDCKTKEYPVKETMTRYVTGTENDNHTGNTDHYNPLKAEKVYDGNALTAEGSITGFVNGETATFVTTGSQTEVGNSENTLHTDMGRNSRKDKLYRQREP